MADNQITVTVLATKTNTKYTNLVVEGNTLADLKRALNGVNCDYSGMAFFEGRTCSELLNDTSTFQSGAIFRLTPKEKKITSGNDLETRADAIAFIKANNLMEAVKKANGGKNYTNLPTVTLLDFAKKQSKKLNAAAPKPTKVETPAAPAPVATEEAVAAIVGEAPTCSCGKEMSKQEWIDYGATRGFIDARTVNVLFSGMQVSNISSEDEKLFNFIPKK